jgi:hypothetical protein
MLSFFPGVRNKASMIWVLKYGMSLLHKIIHKVHPVKDIAEKLF